MIESIAACSMAVKLIIVAWVTTCVMFAAAALIVSLLCVLHAQGTRSMNTTYSLWKNPCSFICCT